MGLEVKACLEHCVVVVGQGVVGIAKLHGQGDAIQLEVVAQLEAEVGDVEALSGIIPIELITYTCRTPEGSCPRLSTCYDLHIQHIAKGLCVGHLEV